MARTLKTILTATSAILLAGVSAPALAQTVNDTSVPAIPDLTPPDAAPGDERDAATAEERRTARRASRPRVDATPYIEINQVVSAELGNGGDVLTYSTVAVGLDTAISTRQAQAAASVRYERRFGWGDRLADQDILSGLLRGRYDLTQGFALEAGALATRASVDGRGSRFSELAGSQNGVADLYSVYAGPTFGRSFGDVDVGAAYRFGYSRSEIDAPSVLPGGATGFGTFDDSTNHALIGSVGMRPGTNALNLGWLISGGLEQENAGQLDQRYEAQHLRLDLTMPVTPTVAVVGGVGYENIELSQRAPLLTAAGAPQLDARGRLISDLNQPRQIAFETDGLIWDAGVLWRPSRRMALEARVGRRYGSTTYTGSWTWQQSANTFIQLGVYDNFSTVGRQLNNALATAPTDLNAFRDPTTGALDGCAFGAGGSTCFTPTTANLSGFGFRNRGAVLSLSTRDEVWSWGAAFGYDRRRYVVGSTPGLGLVDGAADELFFASLSASRPIDQRTQFSSSLYLSVFDSGIGSAFDNQSAGANAAIARSFTRWLSGTAAFGVNAVEQEGFDTRVFGSALLGLRANF